MRVKKKMERDRVRWCIIIQVKMEEYNTFVKYLSTFATSVINFEEKRL